MEDAGLLKDSPDAYPSDDPWGDDRGRVWINLSGDDMTNWNSMVGIATSIVGQQYTYNAYPKLVGSISESNAWLWVALNSNSFVTSIMYHMGIDPATHMPTNLGVTPGDNTLLDIAGGHTLSANSWFSDIFAGDGADTVNGNSAKNYLFGGSGADVLNGGAGDDILSGGLNADLLNGDDGDDILFGNGTGPDWLRGGNGSDVLYGSAGTDTFDFDALAESVNDPNFISDRIYNFEDGIDRIDLFTIDADPNTPGNQSFQFIGTSAFTGVGQIKYATTSAVTAVFVNGVGPGGAEMKIVIQGVFALTADDFVL